MKSTYANTADMEQNQAAIKEMLSQNPQNMEYSQLKWMIMNMQ